MGKKKLKHEIFSWVITMVIAIVIAFTINKGLIVNATIPSASMESTIMTGDRLISNRLAYFSEEPKRGDIITFVFREDNNKLYIKRLIGLPGEVVEIEDGEVYVNGTLLEEDYLNPNYDTGDYGPFIVPYDQYLFLGDNRSNSKDSRFWTNPFIEKDDLVGKAMIKYYPNFEIFD